MAASVASREQPPMNARSAAHSGRADASEEKAAAAWDLAEIAADLRSARQRWRKAHHRHLEVGVDGFPSRQRIEAAVADLCAALFPQRLGEADGEADEDGYVGHVLARGLQTLLAEVRLELRYWDTGNSVAFDDGDVDTIVRHFAASLPEIRALIDSDVEAAFLGDPAARSVDEILICYPCALAIIHHRLAHRCSARRSALGARGRCRHLCRRDDPRPDHHRPRVDDRRQRLAGRGRAAQQPRHPGRRAAAHLAGRRRPRPGRRARAMSASPRARSVEAPTLIVAVVIHGAWLALTWWHAALPAWALVAGGGWLVAWHKSLQHAYDELLRVERDAAQPCYPDLA